MEEVFLCNIFYVGKEGASEADFPIFVWGLVDVLYFDGDIEFHGGEQVFSDKLPVDARDVYATVKQGFNMWEEVMSCRGILIAFGVQDTITGTYIKEGELCIEQSSCFKNPGL